jgi:uncharacterized membrane protein YoaK (UPF0700 family)
MRFQPDATGQLSPAGWWPSPMTTRYALVVLLSIASGFSDALGYVALGRVFTANMTGNTILLGLAIGQGHIPAALRSVAALAGYAIGILLAGMIVARRSERSLWPSRVTVVVAGEALVLLVFTLWGTIASPSVTGGVMMALLVVVLAMAMGMQSVALHVLGVPGVASTAISTTWISVVSALSDWILMLRRLCGGAAMRDRDPTGVRVQLLVIGSYLLAAVAAAVAVSHWQLTAAAVPTGMVMLVAVIAFLRYGFRSAETTSP